MVLLMKHFSPFFLPFFVYYTWNITINKYCINKKLLINIMNSMLKGQLHISVKSQVIKLQWIEKKSLDQVVGWFKSLISKSNIKKIHKTTATYRASWIIRVNLVGPGRNISMIHQFLLVLPLVMPILCYTVCSYLQFLNVGLRGV